jgi:restriction system protein
MAIPDYQTVMLPLLRLAAKHGKLKLKEATVMLTDEFSLSDQEKATLLPSGKQAIIYNRVGWASMYLRKAKLLSLPQRGVMEITDRGKSVLADNPDVINVKFLERFPEFVEFRSVSTEEDGAKGVLTTVGDEIGTPEEVLEEAHAQLKNQVCPVPGTWPQGRLSNLNPLVASVFSAS